MGCIYVIREPWGVLLLALAEILLWKEANLVSINSTSSRLSLFAAFPSGCHILLFRTPNNANSVSKLCGTKLSTTLVFIAFLGNEDKIPKMAMEDNLSDFGLVCAAGISGAISPSSFIQIRLSICSNRSSRQGPKLWYSNFSIIGHLSARICITRSCCFGLREYQVELISWIFPNLKGLGPLAHFDPSSPSWLFSTFWLFAPSYVSF